MWGCGSEEFRYNVGNNTKKEIRVMKKYYSVTIEKDTKYRAEYLQGIDDFLWAEKFETDKMRSQFISPEKYKKNSVFYREQFIALLGFPLTINREMPVVEKSFVVKDGNINIYRMQFEF